MKKPALVWYVQGGTWNTALSVRSPSNCTLNLEKHHSWPSPSFLLERVKSRQIKWHAQEHTGLEPKYPKSKLKGGDLRWPREMAVQSENYQGVLGVLLRTCSNRVTLQNIHIQPLGTWAPRKKKLSWGLTVAGADSSCWDRSPVGAFVKGGRTDQMMSALLETVSQEIWSKKFCNTWVIRNVLTLAHHWNQSLGRKWQVIFL